MYEKRMGIGYLFLGIVIIMVLLTANMVDIKKQTDRIANLETKVSELQVAQVGIVTKTEIQDIIQASAIDRQVVHELRSDFDNWEGLWDQLFGEKQSRYMERLKKKPP